MSLASALMAVTTGPRLPAAQIEIVGAAAAAPAAEVNADEQHAHQVHEYGD